MVVFSGDVLRRASPFPSLAQHGVGVVQRLHQRRDEGRVADLVETAIPGSLCWTSSESGEDFWAPT